MIKTIVWLSLLNLALGSASFAKSKAEFQRIIPLAPRDHIVVDVTVPQGDVTISYAHAGEISIAAAAQDTENKDLPADFFDHGLAIERNGNHVKIQFASDGVRYDKAVRISYTIGVPNWIEVNSSVGSGNQTISGVMGPVKAICGSGDVRVLYITDALEAKTDIGNITVVQVGRAATVETGTGNIGLKNIGPGSFATVKKGTGTISVDGVSGSFSGSSDAGELDIKGAVYDSWQLTSVSGNIHITTSEPSFEIDAATRSGRLSVANDDIKGPGAADVQECHQKVNGGGKLIQARSTSGNIFIQKPGTSFRYK